MNLDQPITTVLKIRYKENFKNECLQWMQETASVAASFDGFIEKGIYASVETDRELINIFTFKNSQFLEAWENSEERITQTKKSQPFVEAIQSKSQLAGLEFMFPAVKSAKRWKMVTVTIAIIFILLNSLVPVLQQFFTMLHLPMLLKSLLGISVMVSLMTFLILPFLSKILRHWLVS